jgi:hypothetical protein
MGHRAYGMAVRRGGDMGMVLQDLAQKTADRKWVHRDDVSRRMWKSARDAAFRRLKKKGLVSIVAADGEILVSLTTLGRAALAEMEP